MTKAEKGLPWGWVAHPLADTLPMMDDARLDALAADIKANGLREPILIDTEGRVVDGRNRLVAMYRASGGDGEEALRLGLQFAPVPPGADLVAVVISANLSRRHLRKDQLAALTLRVARQDLSWPARVAATALPGNNSGASRESVALAAVSGVSWITCKGVLRVAQDPGAFDELCAGTLTVDGFRRRRGLSSATARRKAGIARQIDTEVEKRTLAAERTRQELLTERARTRTLTQELLQTQDQLAALTALGHSPAAGPPPVRRITAEAQREAAAVVLMSDWHFEERILPGAVAGLNEYNPDIARMRVGKLIEGVLWNLDLFRHGFSIDTLVAWLGGDLITGYLHESLVESNWGTPLEALQWVRDVIVNDVFRPLLLETDLARIVVPCSYGNHSRTKPKKQVKGAATNSYEWLLYHDLARHFAGEPRLEFHIAEGDLLYLDVYGTTLRFSHGDMIQYLGGVGGPLISLNKAINGWDTARKADLTCVGHLHTYHAQARVVMNGSLIGYSEFAQHIKAPFEPPQQAFFLVDSEKGPRYINQIWVEGSDATASDDCEGA